MAYDDASRFAGFTNGAGAQIEYVRDMLDRVTEVRTQPDAATAADITTYEYDAAGNITQITDTLGGITTFTYDIVGRLEQRTLPNGIVTAYTYDLRDRITTLEHRSGAGTILASFTYQRAASGEPTNITREDGSRTEIDYSPSFAIAAERRFNSSGALMDETAYTYDLDGNRTSKTTATNAESYNYAPGFQLATVDTTSGNDNYTTDANGRVTAIDRDGTVAAIAYNSTDRTESVTTAGATTNYTHDAAGRRVGIDDASGSRNLLVAPTLGDGLDSPPCRRRLGHWQPHRPLRLPRRTSTVTLRFLRRALLPRRRNGLRHRNRQRDRRARRDIRIRQLRQQPRQRSPPHRHRR